ncbi:S8 family peptidase [Mycoplasma sp. HU2014]|uniref:S8 family peptidase n=1 Tax=Mycoplasma sp. HU2014 TaxID=1664275 RepID=UPI00067BE92B|nr:S8 family peptidase [Mycoplasma sp. HU2014]KNG79135.1 peptidase S8 domain protein [Mycoplasma sp. HU2014]
MSNKVIELRNEFKSEYYTKKISSNQLPNNAKLNIKELINLKEQLITIKQFWNSQKLKINPLVSVHYKRIISKSNRIKAIFENDALKNNKNVVGAKFSKTLPSYHIITYCITNEILENSILNLKECINYLNKYQYKELSQDDILYINKNFDNSFSKNLTKTRLINTIIDTYYIKSFEVDQFDEFIEGGSIITIYDIKIKTSEILKQLDINPLTVPKLNETTFYLNTEQLKQFIQKAPYLIAMGINDISKMDPLNSKEAQQTITEIKKPSNEPIIGVIDTLFDKQNTYFSEWVEYEDRLDENINRSVEDYIHGTQVSSIIVDGHRLNPELDDGCGYFRVKHFGVAKQTRFSSFTLLKEIESIIRTNKNIKVWNLSLGSTKEINENFISIEAEFLDRIQAENNVIFVISGTNKTSNEIIKIGAPADSINSIVVNSVDYKNNPTDYSRSGPVLSLFNKPDISYYGGSHEKGIRVCSGFEQQYAIGTSFAAPWIARKLCYLIEVIGMSKEVAKALLIHSSTNWTDDNKNINTIGHGVVPIHIKDILETPKDEIRFIIQGTATKYETFNYTLPVPLNKDYKHPFVSKLTMCYFPKVSKTQGVDYTDTEMDIKFGKIIQKNRKIMIDPINKNKQSYDEPVSIFEQEARQKFKKWNNTKHIQQNLFTNTGRIVKPTKSKQEQGYWGINILTKERLETVKDKNLKYGLVVTLKSVDKNNYYADFIKSCQFRGWIVTQIDIENKVEVYNKSNETIKFD